ncbi:MAG: TonB-dependent receptor [Acidobacteriaceae bacterium]
MSPPIACRHLALYSRCHARTFGQTTWRCSSPCSRSGQTTTRRPFPLTANLLLFLFISIGFHAANAQTTTTSTGSVYGHVLDPSGDVVRGANVTVTSATTKTDIAVTSNGVGTYQVPGLAPGLYNITVDAEGFAIFTAMGIQVAPGQSVQANAPLTLEAEQQNVQVNVEAPPIDTSPDSNANAVVLKGQDLHALADDPDELTNQLQALAGPSAGPNGAELYVDGFSGGQVPPKASIREIRINQNPFSAEYDRLGYGRIEILTKGGTDKFHGNIYVRGNSSAFNAKNPILNSNLPLGSKLLKEPAYYSYYFDGNVGGPVTKTSSFFTDVFSRNIQNVKIVDAVDPASITSAKPNGTAFNESVSNPRSRIDASSRFDLQLGQSNTLSLLYSFYRNIKNNQGIGQTSLPPQGYNASTTENDFQAIESAVLGRNYVNNFGFQYRRIRDAQVAEFTSPAVKVQGVFTAGGNKRGTVRDNQDDLEVQDDVTGSKGSHQLNFGGRLRVYRDANYSNAGTNGAYVFQSAFAFLNRAPQIYQVTVVNNNQYTALSTLYDGALFYQDDWKVNRRLTFSYGTRWETQNYINDRSDWAPRIYLAYEPGHVHKKPKTILRAGYGWFYERFTVPDSFSFTGGTPYVAQTIHYNLPANPTTPSNQQIFIENNPPYSETSPGNANKPPNPGSTTSAPAYYTIATNFHSALDMQGSIGIDRRISKRVTANLTYLYSRGIHQYLTNNISAPYFSGVSDTYPNFPLTPPSSNIYQFQSDGVYLQNQFIATVNARFHRVRMVGFYTYNRAKGDTAGVNYFPSNAHDPAFDYGRTPFDIAHRFVLSGNIQAPSRVAISPFVVYNSGIPYNISIGSDLTANNQFNARPTFSNPANGCAAPLVPYGQYCLDPNPVGTNEKVIPYGLGTGPSNFTINLRIRKVFGFGPILGGSSNSRNGGGSTKDSSAIVPHTQFLTRFLRARYTAADMLHKYNFAVSAYAVNLFNRQNLGIPNGTLISPFFGKSQSLATGAFATGTADNRSIFLQGTFSF